MSSRRDRVVGPHSQKASFWQPGWRTFFAIVLTAGFVAYCHATCTPQTQPRLQDQPVAVPVTASIGDIPTLETARILLRAHESDRAAAVFQTLWDARETIGDSQNVRRHIVACYLGLCAEIKNDVADARLWYGKARESTRITEGQDAYFFHVPGRLPPRAPMEFVLVSLENIPALTTADDTRTNSDAAQKQLDAAITEYQDKLVKAPIEKLKALIRVMSWRFMYAELACDEKLYSKASDEFIRAWEERLAIEDELAKDKKTWDEIKKDPQMMLRLDAVDIRQMKIKERELNARKKEVERLNALRELVQTYKRCNEQFALIGTAFALKDQSQASEAVEKIIKDIAAIEASVRKSTQDDQYLLMASEKDIKDIAEAAKIRAPFSDNLPSHMKAINALLASQEVLTNLKNRRSLNSLTKDFAQSDVAKAVDPNNAFLPYTLSMLMASREILAASTDRVSLNRLAEAIKDAEAQSPR